MEPKKRTTGQSEGDDTASNLEAQNVQKSPNNKKARLFSAKEFRTKLKTAERKEALVNFLNICSKENGEFAIKEYLDKGGNCLELLQLLDSDLESSHCVIFNLVNHILLQIISNHPTLHSQNLEACKFLLSTNFPLINKMLSFGSITEERKSILKLLATFVTFSNSLGREILQNINFNVGNLQVLSKQTGEKDSVRSAFIK
ncbi:uncharacterized protein LOC108734797 [Agrilus planipennis]|uniref:Uncharacterized protein LOC108734797 n=1 Tax=Agrilus planipennis TaxID=224129 RepID=A0A7F5RLZ1_AGRPL|nr:uncharacterized protein LOC108734797 [Agrilus planipennis]